MSDDEPEIIIESMAKAAYDYYLHLEAKIRDVPNSYAWIRSTMIAPHRETRMRTWHVRGGINYTVIKDTELTFAHWDETQQVWSDTAEQMHDREAVGDDPLL
ncbi:MAG: hypothetical protein OXC99_04105 [Chloroflexi bacterium]|nr:hypothetical protein [Chloroflexota bacterium]